MNKGRKLRLFRLTKAVVPDILGAVHGALVCPPNVRTARSGVHSWFVGCRRGPRGDLRGCMRLVDTQLALPSFDQPVEVQIAGARGAPLVIDLAGSRPTSEAPCWDVAAELLSDYGFQVALPDLHATPQTSPVALSTADAVKLVAECADALEAQYFCIMGWHWGASVAFNTARTWPQRMLRIVLAAPPISDPAIIRSLPGVFPVLLLWAARDAVVPLRLAQSFVTELGPRLTLSVSLDDGDAAIPPELLRSVHQFLSS